MEGFESKTNRKPFGYCNPSFTGSLDYSFLHNFKQKVRSNDWNESFCTCCSGCCNAVLKHSCVYARALRSTSDPSRERMSVVPMMHSLSLDDGKNKVSSCETAAASTNRDHSPTLGKLQSLFSGKKCYSKLRNPNSEKDLHQTAASVRVTTYLKNSSKECALRQRSLSSSFKFFCRGGLPSQTGNFTPTIHRRAVSLRGASSKANVEAEKLKQNCSVSPWTKGCPLVKRSNSEKIANKSESCISHNRENARSPPSANIFLRGNSEDSPMIPRDRCRDNLSSSLSLSIDDSFSLRSESSHDSFDITELVKQNLCDNRVCFQSSEAIVNNLLFLNKNLEEYVLSLSELLMTYGKMKQTSPEKIRLHFDLPMKSIKDIFNLQREINKTIRESNGDLLAISGIFLSDDFRAYQQYMVMSPSIYEDLRLYKDHFEVNFPNFKNLILMPSSRLNFYTQTLTNFLKFATLNERRHLERAINYLENLKRNANTEMTVKIVKASPVDLHLAGNIIHAGELIYVSGPLPKRSYYLIVFQHMLLVTISRVSYLTYVTHYRPEQIVSVQGRENKLQLTLAMTSGTQGLPEIHKFKNSSDKVLDRWFLHIEEWIFATKASYEIAKDSKEYFLTYNTGKNFPLSLWQVFPSLKQIYLNEKQQSSFPTYNDTYQLCRILVEKEREYVDKLNSIFNPETLPPPAEIKDLLQRILNLHEIYFYPELKNALNKNPLLVVDIFVNYLEKFETYKTYLIKRSLCTTHMPDGIKAQHYIIPVQQFSFYIEWSRELRKNYNFCEASTYAVETLLSYIMEAKVMLLHEAIPNCCLDFFRTGELKKGGQLSLRVRPRKKGLRDGKYIILLFEKVLLILRTTTPTYNLAHDIWLNQVNFGPPSENSKAFKLENRQGRNKLPITFEFKTEDALSKQQWVEHLGSELQSQADQIKSCSLMQKIS